MAKNNDNKIDKICREVVRIFNEEKVNLSEALSIGMTVVFNSACQQYSKEDFNEFKTDIEKVFSKYGTVTITQMKKSTTTNSTYVEPKTNLLN
jgi:hypothetical protein